MHLFYYHRGAGNLLSLGGEFVPEEHFIEILPLKKANAESIYSALVENCRERNISWEGL